MLYDSTIVLLRSIVQRIEKQGVTEFDDCLQSGNQCLYELHQMSAHSIRTHHGETRFNVLMPAFERANRAIPHVKAMMKALRSGNKAEALENGRAALAQMSGTRPEAPSTSGFAANAGIVVSVKGRGAPVATLPRRKQRS